MLVGGPARPITSTTAMADLSRNVLNRLPQKSSIDAVTIPFGPLDVVVESEAPDLVPSLMRIYSSACPPDTRAGDTNDSPVQRIEYQVVREIGQESSRAGYTVIRDRKVQYWNYPEDGLVNCLEWNISSVASKSLNGYHRIHAGALANNGHGILLPGPSGSGKSTTTAALALNGFTYCSDEYALVGQDARLYAFPKIISLKPGGWRQIVRDFPEEVSLLGWPDVAGNGIWQVRAPVVPDERESQEGYPVDFVIVPRYQPGQATTLEPISRSLALKELIEQSLDLQIRGGRGLEMLVEVVRSAECYSLSVSSLRKASELVKGLTI